MSNALNCTAGFSKSFSILLLLGTICGAEASAQTNCPTMVKAAGFIGENAVFAAIPVFAGDYSCEGATLVAIVTEHWGDLTCDAKEHYFLGVQHRWGGTVILKTEDSITVAQGDDDNPRIRRC